VANKHLIIKHLIIKEAFDFDLILNWYRKTATEGAEVTGRLFQTRAAATGKARSPSVGSPVRLTIDDEDKLERSR